MMARTGGGVFLDLGIDDILPGSTPISGAEKIADLLWIGEVIQGLDKFPDTADLEFFSF